MNPLKLLREQVAERDVALDKAVLRVAELEAEVVRLREALRGKMDEYKMHDPGYCAFCDVAVAALRSLEPKA
jgi:hypothetical protein